MSVNKVQAVKYEFGPFRLDASKRILLRGEEPVHLSPKAFDLLLVLVENSNRIVSREEIMSRVWPDCFVEEINLTVQVSALRKALGDNASQHQYILTVLGQGYRFGADLTELGDRTNGSRTTGQVALELLTDEEMGGRRDEAVESRITEGATLMLETSAEKRIRPSWIIVALAAAAILAALAAAAILAIIIFWPSGKTSDQAAGVKAGSIAVLPFKRLDSETEEYIGLGLADALITKLTNVKQVIVRPTSSIMKYQDQQDLQAAGRELGVDLLLNGAIQRSGGDIRVTVQLVRASDGIPIWGEEFRESYSNLFEVQDTIAKRVVDALMLKLSEPESMLLAKRYTQNIEAYQLYMKGRYYWNKRTEQGFEKAIEQFNQAVALDRNFALAYTGLADSYILLTQYLLAPTKNYCAKAREAAISAIEIDESLAEAHASLGLIRLWCDYNLESAERHFRRAIELNPNYPTAHHWYSLYFITKGDTAGAKAELERALEIDPVSLIINSTVGTALYYARQYEQSVDQFRKVLEMDPDFVPALHNVGVTYEHMGRFDEALAFLKKSMKLSPASVTALAHLYAVMGRTNEARKMLINLEKEREKSYVSALRLAMVYAGLGDKEKTFHWLEQAYNDRDTWLVYLGVDPRFDPLRSDPRFADLMKRIGLI